jgi:uncharacterized hydrophobic protein (TIGR00341 family)
VDGGLAVLQRLIEIVVPEEAGAHVVQILTDRSIAGRWRDDEAGNLLFRAVIPAEDAEPVMDRLQERFGDTPGFSVILIPLAAALPRPEPESPPGPSDQTRRTYRVSREELYAEAAKSIRTSPIFIAMTVLSAVVASVGLYADNLAVVIGAMMIAPLLAPNVTLALGTALGDLALIRDALKANLVGVSIALLVSVAVGFLFTIDPTVPAIAVRTVVDPTDLLLALAAGAAGTLAFTSGMPSAVIGVMVAVALLPPLANFGLLIGSGHLQPALGAFLLVTINVICVNLAGVLTFLAQGVRPATWWEAERARKATRTATVIWAVLLTLLALTLVLSQSPNAR